MDQTRDLSGQKLYKLSQQYTTPDFVKSATVADLCGEGDMGSELYGDPIHRIYPCHTPAATWTSAAFFLNDRGSFKEADAKAIDDRLEAYAGYHKISHSINRLRKEATGSIKNASDESNLCDDDFAVVYTTHGVKHRYYPLRNSKEVKTAADYLSQHRDAFPYNLRRDFADKILQKAASCGADLGDTNEFIERTAGHGGCSSKAAIEMLRDRVKAAQAGPGPASELQAELSKLADSLEAAPSKIRTPGVRVKMAQVVSDYDVATGISKNYSDTIRRPEDVLFEFTNEKLASVMSDHISNPFTGNVYLLSDIEKIKTANVKDYLGEDFADAVAGKSGYVDSEKVATIVPTMDRNFAQLFDKMLSEFNVSPAIKEASMEAVGLSRAYLLEMASSYRKAIGEA